MNAGEARDVQVVLSYFLDPHGRFGDRFVMDAVMRLAEAAYKMRGGLTPNEVRILFGDVVELPKQFDWARRQVEDVPTGDVL